VSLLNVTPVLIFRSFVLFGLVPAEVEVGVKYQGGTKKMVITKNQITSKILFRLTQNFSYIR